MAGNDWDRRYKVWYNKVLEDMDSLDVNWEDVHPFLRLLMEENITSLFVSINPIRIYSFVVIITLLINN